MRLWSTWGSYGLVNRKIVAFSFTWGILGIKNWPRRIYHQNRQFENASLLAPKSVRPWPVSRYVPEFDEPPFALKERDLDSVFGFWFRAKWTESKRSDTFESCSTLSRSEVALQCTFIEGGSKTFPALLMDRYNRSIIWFYNHGIKKLPIHWWLPWQVYYLLKHP